MSKSITRRRLLKTLCALLGSTAIRPLPAHALDTSNSSTTPFTKELAVKLATIFAERSYPDICFTEYRASLLLSLSADPLGYVVHYYVDNIPYGYIVFDTSYNGLISRFYIHENVTGPVPQYIGNDRAINDSVPFQYVLADALTFGAISPSCSSAQYNNGKTSTLPPSFKAKAKDPSTWQDPMISMSEAAGMHITNERWLGDFRYVTEYEMEQNTSTYACVPMALYCIAANLPTSNGFLINNPWSQWSEVQKIWGHTHTTVHNEENGIKYGSTPDNMTGIGFKNYAQEKGRTITYRYTTSPTFTEFRNQVNSVQHSVIQVGINEQQPDGTIIEVGHGMTVQGYATLSTIGVVPEDTTNCVLVYDGWSSMVYLNFDFPQYTRKSGVFFQM